MSSEPCPVPTPGRGLFLMRSREVLRPPKPPSFSPTAGRVWDPSVEGLLPACETCQDGGQIWKVLRWVGGVGSRWKLGGEGREPGWGSRPVFGLSGMAALGQGCFPRASNLAPSPAWVTSGKAAEGMRVGCTSAGHCSPSSELDSRIWPLPCLLSGNKPCVHTGCLSRTLHFRLFSVGDVSLRSGRETGQRIHRWKWT